MLRIGCRYMKGGLRPWVHYRVLSKTAPRPPYTRGLTIANATRGDFNATQRQLWQYCSNVETVKTKTVIIFLDNSICRLAHEKKAGDDGRGWISDARRNTIIVVSSRTQRSRTMTTTRSHFSHAISKCGICPINNEEETEQLRLGFIREEDTGSPYSVAVLSPPPPLGASRTLPFHVGALAL